MVRLSAVFTKALNDGRAENIDQVHGVLSLDSEGHKKFRPRRFAEAKLEFLVGFDIPRDGIGRQFDEGWLRI
jgi:hypothetical protein